MVTGDQLQTGYVTMKTTLPPFDNLKVRRAVNMAVNKDRIVRIINGRAAPANQPLPPAMPGYDKAYQGFSYDPAKAKQLLSEAGFPNGFATELYVMNTDPQPRIAQSIQRRIWPKWASTPASNPWRRRCDCGGRLRQPSADGLVRRHGVDRRFPGSLQLLWPDPQLRRGGRGRLELGALLQQSAGRAGGRGGQHGETRPAGRSH